MTSKKKKIGIRILIIVLIIWGGLTIWVQFSEKDMLEIKTAANEEKRALIIYNPDPIYNLDEQVCMSFAEGLVSQNVSSTVASLNMLKEKDETFDLYVFCVNTYNWAPDWQLTNYIKSHPNLDQQKACAITVGAGSTMRAQRKLEWHLQDKGVELLGSEMYWLLRPNDENRMKDKNVEVAKDQAKAFGKQIG
ncbi:MAG: hypothetical protein HKN54_05475, partial [Flavobacteriaceae bacterium]|nr:hypothetical protein [Flavobacteriaceae bacterium]